MFPPLLAIYLEVSCKLVDDEEKPYRTYARLVCVCTKRRPLPPPRPPPRYYEPSDIQFSLCPLHVHVDVDALSFSLPLPLCTLTCLQQEEANQEERLAYISLHINLHLRRPLALLLGRNVKLAKGPLVTWLRQ